MASFSSPLLIGVFAAAAAVTWIAGVELSKATDAIDRRYGLGEALGGVILLAIRPGLCRRSRSRSARRQAGISAWPPGNLIGGIAIQTMVIVLCDAAASRTQSLTFLVGSLIPVLEGLAVIAVVAEVNMGSLLPEHVAIGPVSPVSIAIVVTWLAGVVVLNNVRHGSRWECVMPRSKPGRPHRRVPLPGEKPGSLTSSPARAIAIFAAAALVTLGAGVLLEVSGNQLADRWHVNGVIFGATVTQRSRRRYPRSARGSPPYGSVTTSSRSPTSSAATPSRSACSWSPT